MKNTQALVRRKTQRLSTKFAFLERSWKSGLRKTVVRPRRILSEIDWRVALNMETILSERHFSVVQDDI